MRLEESLECIASAPRPDDFSVFAEHLPSEWIEGALEATGVATLRKRRLPMESVPWLIIGMALMRDRPITEVVNKLDLAIPNNQAPAVS